VFVPVAHPAPRSGSRALWILPVILLFALLGIGAFGWTQGWFAALTGGSGSPSPIVVTSTHVVPAPPAAPPQTQVAVPAPVPVPAGASPVSGAARTGGEAGRFMKVYTGTDVTSAPFAEAVASEFRRVHVPGAGPDTVLTAWSPVTGQSYRMTCSDNGSYVTCRGGNNAVVYIQ